MTLNILKFKIPEKLPKDMQKTVDKLKKAKSKEDCLKKAWDILRKKYRGASKPLITRWFDIWTTDIKEIWGRKKGSLLHCTALNYLMRALLIKSGWFKDRDIRSIWTFLWIFSIHQYLKVKIDSRWVAVDVWGANKGIKFGDHAHGFHF